MSKLYTPEYIKQLQSLHNDRGRSKGFGGKVKKLGEFHNYIKLWNPSSLLDYGCGKGHILSYLKETYPTIRIDGYDPALPMFSKVPNTLYDCVFSNDVLEHIEPEMLPSVLTHINHISVKYLWLRIDTAPARKVLPDGRNAHLIQESQEWWTRKLEQYINGKIIFNTLDSKGKLDVAIEK